MHARMRIAMLAMLLLASAAAMAGEPQTPLERARQFGGIYAIGKEGCGVSDTQLAAFKRQADQELHGDKTLVAAYEKSLTEMATTIRQDKAWLASPHRDRDCVPTRMLFAATALKN